MLIVHAVILRCWSILRKHHSFHFWGGVSLPLRFLSKFCLYKGIGGKYNLIWIGCVISHTDCKAPWGKFVILACINQISLTWPSARVERVFDDDSCRSDGCCFPSLTLYLSGFLPAAQSPLWYQTGIRLVLVWYWAAVLSWYQTGIRLVLVCCTGRFSLS